MISVGTACRTSVPARLVIYFGQQLRRVQPTRAVVSVADHRLQHVPCLRTGALAGAQCVVQAQQRSHRHTQSAGGISYDRHVPASYPTLQSAVRDAEQLGGKVAGDDRSQFAFKIGQHVGETLIVRQAYLRVTKADDVREQPLAALGRWHRDSLAKVSK